MKDRPLLTALEQTILRSVLENDRGRGITDENHDEASRVIIGLVQRGLLRYNPERTRQKFSLTWIGRSELDRAEKTVNGTSLEAS